MDINLNRTFTIDIESNALLEQSIDHSSMPYKLKPECKLHCVVLYCIGTEERFTFICEEISKESISKVLSNCDVLISHHGLKFDLVYLLLRGVLDYEVAYPPEFKSEVNGYKMTLIDTHVMSRLFNPDRFGGHSLDAWGERLGFHKIHWREVAIELGLIEKTSPKGEEFKIYHPKMLEYCIRDTEVTAKVFLELKKELDEYPKWANSLLMEHKLADLAIRRETMGFGFDKEAALRAVEDLNSKMEELSNRVNPLLPERNMNQGELNDVTPPTRQLTIKNQPTSYIRKFADKHGYELGQLNDEWYMGEHKLPYHNPLYTTVKSSIDDLDTVKMYLIELGWVPSEWRERDLTKDSKKQNLSYEKRISAAERWYKETIGGKYKEERLKELDIKSKDLLEELKKRLKKDKPLRVPTSPSVRVGVEKELCPNLIALGDKVAFAKDFALYLTYKSRRNVILGGNIDEDGEPETGFLSMYRNEDSRIPTPSIELGAATNRYRHIGVCNIPRATSVYGKEMRSLFTSGERYLQMGYDFSSLEARIEGHYVYKYSGGPELAEMLIAEKPNDIHTITSVKLGIPRDDAKSFNYAILYGAQPKKLAKMLNCSISRGEELFKAFWEANPALKELKDNLEKYWLTTGKKYILGIDGRKIMTRSQHSLLNALFQSAGVIAAKYTTIYLFRDLEKSGYRCNPFKSDIDVMSMIEYHDEAQLCFKPEMAEFKKFSSKENAKEFSNFWEKDNGQLSSISEGTTWYLTLPNDISKTIGRVINLVSEELKLNVPLGYEWIVNKNWYGCH